MLLELAVTDLGVIDRMQVVFGEGMTALTGETGAGKTLIVEAIDLLVGGRADSVLVRAGAEEAVVEGRFLIDGDEQVLRRVVPRAGRSRAYIDGSLARVSDLSAAGARLVDLHGQHGHQSLLHREAQREALDRYAGIDLTELRDARAEVAAIEAHLASLGGDERDRARELDLLRYQFDEIEAADPRPDEDEQLLAEEDLLADAEGHRAAAATALEALSGDGGATDRLAAATTGLRDRRPFADVEVRLRSILAEAEEAARDLRAVDEGIELDPARLDAVRERRRLLSELRRKYGDSLQEVLDHARSLEVRLADLEAHEETANRLELERIDALDRVGRAEHEVGEARRAAAPSLAAVVASRLGDLALGGATLEIAVGADPGDDVEILVSTNTGAPALPLRKVASGGELARIMLALRLELTAGPPTLVFDEVDAGIGGEAAVAVGQALAALAGDHQVLVVTHLPQVAAAGDEQVAIRKRVSEGATVTTAVPLDEAARVVELSRMLSGSPGSERARGHAAELLASAERERAR